VLASEAGLRRMQGSSLCGVPRISGAASISGRAGPVILLRVALASPRG